MRPEDEQYFSRIEEQLEAAFDRAEAARRQGRDPEPEIEIPVARDMADRVENLLEITGVAKRVRELEGEMSREEAALELVKDFVDGSVGSFETRADKVEGAVRTAVALLTEGVVAAPIEGIDRVELLENDDGTEFINVYYAGPIRSAGGTAQALSVLVADYARSLLGIEEFHAREQETERYAEEVGLYDKETGLQATPKPKEIKYIVKHLPIMLDGEATGSEEVSGFRDLERVDTNSTRGGMCLVLAEGIALKAPKIQRYTRNLDEVEWPWLQELIDGAITGTDSDEQDNIDDAAVDTGGGDGDDVESAKAGSQDGPIRPDASKKFLRDLIAGRPVFSHPSESGGFRLRYGRARNHGFATAGIHPATMHLVDDFLATGTQIKTERPGKAAGVIPVDSIEGPTVKLANGSVRRIDDPEEAKAVRNGVEKVLDLGEYLVNYGEFVENNHPLAPASYTYEWWVKEFQTTDARVQALQDDPRIDLTEPPVDTALTWAEEYDCPLHPTYTYLWHDITVDTFLVLAEAVEDGETNDGALVLERTETTQVGVESLLLDHSQADDTLRIPEWRPFVRSLGFDTKLRREWTVSDISAEAREYAGGDNAIRAINQVAPFELRERAPTRIGNRMGRPEKSESRDLSPAVHSLFPINEAGGSQRNLADASRQMDDQGRRGVLNLDVIQRECPDCGDQTFRNRCPRCEAHTEPHYECGDCGTVCEPDTAGRVECPRCEWEVTAATEREIDLNTVYRDALENVGERDSAFEILKGVQGLVSTNKPPEPLEKGILRAKNGVTAFKDGTVRYDMTDLPVTAVRPEELDISVDHLLELGYEEDINGEPLQHDDQLVELNVQDIVLSDGAAEHMLKTADFVDDLLEQYYDLPAFYQLDEREDLVGELVFGMAPHTSAATVGRVVGFTSAAVGYAHPYFHAAKRRNCYHPDTKLWVEDESGELRYERFDDFVEKYLDRSDIEYDDFGTAVGRLEDVDTEVRVPSLTREGEQVYRPVEAVSKHRAPDHEVRISTRSGRSITVTPDHEAHVYEADTDELVGKAARNLETSDRLVTPRSIELSDSAETPTRVDLLEEVVDSETVPTDRLMIDGLDEDRLYELLKETLTESQDDRVDSLNNVADALDTNTLRDSLSQGSFSAASLRQCFSSTESFLEFVPETITLGMRGDRAEIDRFVELNERVATLLGVYAATGFTREQDTPNQIVHQTTIRGTDKETCKFLESVFSATFGVDSHVQNQTAVTAPGQLLGVFFDTVLDAGIRAHSKRVPNQILGASKDIVAAYLAGYVTGSDTADGGLPQLKTTTVSDELKEDLLALLSRLGTSATVEPAEQVQLPDEFSEVYATDDEPLTAQAYEISISSEAAVKISEHVSPHLVGNWNRLARNTTGEVSGRRVFDGGAEEYLLDTVEKTELTKPDTEHVYCLTVEGTHSHIANDISAKQCDGDEDCVMLLMDGLLNFSKEFLPDQRGGSVTEDSSVIAVDPDGQIRYLTFDELWKELEAPVEVDGKFRKRTCAFEGWQTYAFDENHQSSLQPIEKAIRYPAAADETLLRVETEFGRSLEITPNHSLFRYADGIEEVAGDDLEKGDLIVAPRQLDIETGSGAAVDIDVAECVDDPCVLGTDDNRDDLRRAKNHLERDDEMSVAVDAGAAFRAGKNNSLLEKSRGAETVVRDRDKTQNASVGRQRSVRGIQRNIPIDEDFAWLLGIFTAQGSMSSAVPTIRSGDDELARQINRVTKNTLDVEPDVRTSDNGDEISFPAVFADVLLELGFSDPESHRSGNRVVPDPIQRGEKPVITAFLQGFVAGDGNGNDDGDDSGDSNETTDNNTHGDGNGDDQTTMSFHTTSQKLKDGLVFLLHRLGIVADVSACDRDGPQQQTYDVTISGEGHGTPLEEILEGQNLHQSKRLVVSTPEELVDLREMDIPDVSRTIPEGLHRRDNIGLATLEQIVNELDGSDLPERAGEKLDKIRPLVEGDLSYLRVESIEPIEYDGHLYDLQVGGDPIFTANWLYAHNSMDAPLVMSSRVDPTEIDDEAHNMDIVREYPLEFYEAARKMADPSEVENLVQLGADTLETDDEYQGFDHTHDVTDIAMGPDLSAYKTLGSMMDKMDAQLELARKLRAVDETDVAERVIEYHFLPDLIGNLRAFARQETRCLDCGEKYRRAPLTGDCRECGGDVILTVHRGSVNKYMDTAIEVADRFDCRPYTKQRLEVLKKSLESVFEDDTNKQSGIADFM